MTAIPDKILLEDGTEIPVIKPGEGTISEEASTLKKAISGMGKKAIEEAFRNNLPVTVGKDGKIVRVYPDGHEEILGDLPQ